MEIEHVVDSLEESGSVGLEKEGTDNPGYEETKLVKDATPPPAKIAALEGFGTRCENLSKDVDEHVVQPDENASEASVDKSNDATSRNVPFDPGYASIMMIRTNN